MTRYELGEVVFASGPSTFHRARNPVLGNELLVRRLAPDPARAEDQRATFFREQRHLAGLRHPYIQKTLDAFEEEGALWSVHPLVPARPTDQILAERGPFDLSDAARIASHVADALAYLHERGFLHGRLSPGFVLVDDRGDTLLTNLVKSADLAAGIWPLREAVRGLGPFSSPEERRGERPTEASDLYGLAALFLHWIHGTTPAPGAPPGSLRETIAAGTAGRAGTPAASPVPRVLADALAAALEPDPARRRGSAAALAALFGDLHSLHAAEVPTGFETGSFLAAQGIRGPVEVLGRIGSGRFGVVLRARGSASGEPLAVKVLKSEHRSDPVLGERFLREAMALRRIRHENVVRVLGIGEAGEVPFLVMDFLDGPMLSTHILRRGALEPAEAASVALGIARGLEAIHGASLLHRDLKPENIMLVGGTCPVITDLGVAKGVREQGLTLSGMVVGTPLYMAPEQAWGGEVGPASDLFALGGVLYECLAGAPPHGGTNLMALFLDVRNRTPAPLPSAVPAALSDLVFRLLRKDPAERPPGAGAVALELEGLMGDLGGGGSGGG